MARIHILAPVHNRRETSRRFIRCLMRQTFKDWSLVLIDDGSSDGTAEMAMSENPATIVLKCDGNLWWGGSLQKGFLWVKSQKLPPDDIVMTINDDSVFEDDFLANAAAAMSGKTGVLLLAKAYRMDDGSFWDAGVHFDPKAFNFARAGAFDGLPNCLSTKGLFMRVSDFLASGGFRPRMLPHYLSDYEFTIRTIRGGLRPLIDDSVRLSSDVSAESTGLHSFSGKSRLDYARKLFSMKSAMNPFHWSAFVILVCPWPWNLINLAKVWVNAARSAAKGQS